VFTGSTPVLGTKPIHEPALVAYQAAAPASNTGAPLGREGSTPSRGTRKNSVTLSHIADMLSNKLIHRATEGADHAPTAQTR
jgi:hypothetical protein